MPIFKTPDKRAEVLVSVQRNGTDSACGLLLDWDRTSVTVHFASREAVGATEAEEVEVCLMFAKDPKRVCVAVAVREARDVDGGCDVKMEYSSGRTEDERERVAQLMHALERRGALRIEPNVPLTIEILPGGEPPAIPGIVGDLSLDGLRVAVDAAQSHAIERAGRVDAVLCLQDGGKPLRLEAGIAWRTTVGETAMFGVAFVVSKSPAFAAAQRALHEYVTECQRKRFHHYRVRDPMHPK